EGEFSAEWAEPKNENKIAKKTKKTSIRNETNFFICNTLRLFSGAIESCHPINSQFDNLNLKVDQFKKIVGIVTELKKSDDFTTIFGHNYFQIICFKYCQLNGMAKNLERLRL
ncbi:MAG TPA: hypothetical protein VIJ93_09585, partial [bacterium]